MTCDDFAQAIADANPGSALAQHLAQFKRWYSQAGTPRLVVRTEHQAEQGLFTLHFEQSCAPTPGQEQKLPFVIPVTLGLLDDQGQALPLVLADGTALGQQHTLVLTEATQSVTFSGLPQAPVPSLLRGFSAPVMLQTEDDDAQLRLLLAHDSDPFIRHHTDLLVRGLSTQKSP